MKEAGVRGWAEITSLTVEAKKVVKYQSES